MPVSYTHLQAEAMAMGGNLGGGKSLLENWVKTYRDPSYSCAATTPEAFQSEIWWQRRVELWGEGHAYTCLLYTSPAYHFGRY